MNTIDLSRGHSYSVMPPCCAGRCAEELIVGGGKAAVLYFELPPHIGAVSVEQARLLLFQLPQNRCGCRCGGCFYHAAPLLEFYSPCGSLFGPPQTDDRHYAAFYADIDRCVTEADVTPIVNAWLSGCIENKGLLLCGGRDTERMVYASHRCELAGMQPRLRLVCAGITTDRPLSVQECAVTPRPGA